MVEVSGFRCAVIVQQGDPAGVILVHVSSRHAWATSKIPPPSPRTFRICSFLTKFRHWEYENEVRRFVALRDAEQDGPLSFWPFDERMQLREVILGHLCAASELEPIRHLVANAQVDAVVSKARLSFGSFKVRPNQRYPPTSAK
jgi:hypothetical protein